MYIYQTTYSKNIHVCRAPPEYEVIENGDGRFIEETEQRDVYQKVNDL